MLFDRSKRRSVLPGNEYAQKRAVVNMEHRTANLRRLNSGASPAACTGQGRGQGQAVEVRANHRLPPRLRKPGAQMKRQIACLQRRCATQPYFGRNRRSGCSDWTTTSPVGEQSYLPIPTTERPPCRRNALAPYGWSIRLPSPAAYESPIPTMIRSLGLTLALDSMVPCT